MTLKPIAIETQIEDAIFGQSADTTESVKLKVDFTTKNIDKVISVNGSKVFYPIVKNGDIWYCLQKAPNCFKVTEQTQRHYYYPIQYANIQFFNDNP